MVRTKRKIKKDLIYSGIGLLIGIGSIFNPIFFLFIIPVLVFLFFQINKKKLIKYVLIILILSSFPAIIFNEKYEFTLSKPNSIGIALKSFVMDVYNIVKFIMIESDLGNIKTMQEPKLIDGFEISDLKNFYLSEDHVNSADIFLDYTQYYKGQSSLKILLELPFNSPLMLISVPAQKEWADYNFVNLWLKSHGFEGMFEFILADNDGDWWHYYDKEILSKQSWTLVKMPLKSFNNPWWTQHGNRKRNFDEIVKYIIKITPDRELIGNYSVNIDEIYLSDI